ncbi:MAG: oxidoreductase [Nitrospirae bacterium RIFCSPLOWO2_02_FULL_62_14]|nr:MAG: oxidoreductase [Nitrospirae bacterium RIFCSPLOWO2_01_FULL_62_17]OGW67808.1 MAG: oxidoreductase [Nitrospirae bacterium RIFCSPLOWO2_02_FULL_62_14]
MKPIRTGVIGVGHLGQHHARLYASLPGATLVGVADADPRRAREIAERLGTAVYDDPGVLLKQVEAVSIAAPTSAHHAVARQCLEAGVHVLVEKPITVSPAEAQELIALARARKAVLQVGHIERFNPVMLKVRPLIREPRVIECRRISPFTGRSTDVDVVLDLMIHDLDMVLSFQPGAVADVRAVGAAVVSDKVDVAHAWISFDSGCVATLTASRVAGNRARELTVVQRDACVSLDYQSRQATIRRFSSGARASGDQTSEQIQGGDEEPLKLELESFLHAVQTGTEPAVSGRDGEAALSLAYRVLEEIGVRDRGVRG